MSWLKAQAPANLPAERGSPNSLATTRAEASLPRRRQLPRDGLSSGFRAASRMADISVTFFEFQPPMGWLKSYALLNLHAERGSPRERLATTRVEALSKASEASSQGLLFRVPRRVAHGFEGHDLPRVPAADVRVESLGPRVAKVIDSV